MPLESLEQMKAQQERIAKIISEGISSYRQRQATRAATAPVRGTTSATTASTRKGINITPDAERQAEREAAREARREAKRTSVVGGRELELLGPFAADADEVSFRQQFIDPDTGELMPGSR